MIVRRKQVSIDGVDITIAALTIDQAREMFVTEKSEPTTRGQIVALSLNNARTNGDPEWSTARLTADMDGVLLQRLYDEIIDFCGLKPEEAEPGEPAAPSET